MLTIGFCRQIDTKLTAERVARNLSCRFVFAMFTTIRCAAFFNPSCAHRNGNGFMNYRGYDTLGEFADIGDMLTTSNE